MYLSAATEAIGHTMVTPGTQAILNAIARAAVEPSIGHLKQEHRMDRNRLKGVSDDLVNAIMSAAGHYCPVISQTASVV